MGELMQAEVTTALKYDYEQIAPGHRDRVMRAAQTIREANKTAIDSVIKIGQELNEVKKRIEHGQFTEWLLAEFALDPRTAQRWMNVAREYGDEQKRHTMSLFSPTVAYLLAAPSTPDEARTEIEEAATEGKPITVEFAKDTIQAHKPRAEIKPVRDEVRPVEAPAPAREVYVEPKIETVEINHSRFDEIKSAGFVVEMRTTGPTVEWRWVWPQNGNSYRGDWVTYMHQACEYGQEWYRAHQPPTPELLTVRDWDDTTTTEPTAEEQAAIAEVAAEREQEEQERLVMETAPLPTVTLTIPRKIAQALHAACGTYALGSLLTLPEQDSLEQALWSAFEGKEIAQ